MGRDADHHILTKVFKMTRQKLTRKKIELAEQPAL
jgi:hypothetical protein